MKRVLIHAGFHKTGTTSAQAFLRENREVLHKNTRLILRHQLKQTFPRANEYSRTGSLKQLQRFQNNFSAILADIPSDDDRQIVISEENLAGQMPGKKGVYGYDALPPLLNAMLECLNTAFTTPPEVTVYFSTRETEGWIKSIWQHSVMAERITDSLAEMQTKLRPAADQKQTLRNLQSFFPKLPIQSRQMEDLRNTYYGLATPLIEWMRLSDLQHSKLIPVNTRNPSPAIEISERLRDMNASKLDDETLQNAKRDIRQAYRLERANAQ